MCNLCVCRGAPVQAPFREIVNSPFGPRGRGRGTFVEAARLAASGMDIIRRRPPSPPTAAPGLCVHRCLRLGGLGLQNPNEPKLQKMLCSIVYRHMKYIRWFSTHGVSSSLQIYLCASIPGQRNLVETSRLQAEHRSIFGPS